MARARHRRRGDRGGQAGGHAAIVARALGLPAAGGARGAIDAAEAGDEAVLDADEGTLILRPDPSVREAYDVALSGPRDAQRRLGRAARRALGHPRRRAVHA